MKMKLLIAALVVAIGFLSYLALLPKEVLVLQPAPKKSVPKSETQNQNGGPVTYVAHFSAEFDNGKQK